MIISGNFLFFENGFVKKRLLIRNGLLSEFVKNGLTIHNRLINAEKYYIIPAFIDGHSHLFAAAKRHEWLDFSKVNSLRELKRIIANITRIVGPKKWVLGYGWDESNWVDEKRYPTLMDLDEVAPNNPVFIRRIDGHLAVVNSIALRVLRIEKKLRGLILDRKGKPTGILKEDALEYASKQLQYNLSALAKGLIKVSLDAHRKGVSMSHETMDLEDLSSLFYALQKISSIDLDFYIFIVDQFLDHLLIRGLHKLTSSNVRIAGIKIFSDGSIGARTAALREPYKDDPSNRGMLLRNRDELAELFRKADNAGLQLAVHAIGDRAIDEVLDAMKIAKIRAKLRHRIEHFELVHDEHVRVAKKLGLIASMQPNFVGQWQMPGGMYEKRLGKMRWRQMNPFRKIIDNGLILSFGSDCMPFDPIFGIWSAINHPVIDSRIDPLTAIKSYTYYSSYAAFSEGTRGEIKLGKRADLVILSHNPLEIQDIRKINILAYIYSGRLEYINWK